MKYLFSLILIFVAMGVSARDLDSMLVQFDKVLERRDTYFMAHEHAIDSAKAVLRLIPVSEYGRRAAALHDIFNLYRSYQGDSARVYADREAEAARASGDPETIVLAQEDRLYSKITGGIFSEGADIVRQTDLSKVSKETKGRFYFYCNRLYTDMSNYADGTFSDENSVKARAYSDSVIALLPPTAYMSQYSQIFKTLENLTTDQKIEIYNGLLRRNDIDLAEKAMIVSILADLYTYKDDKETTAFYKAQSAIYDILSAKRETTSKNDLARIMFELGDLDRADRYIQAALEDADFFNARHRKIEIAKVFPLIQQARYMAVDNERSHLRIFTIILIIIGLVLAGLLFYILVQRRKLSESRRQVALRNDELEKANGELEELNSSLKKAYDSLAESNRIKDEYIGFGFSVNSEYISKLEALYKLVKRKLKVRQYEDLDIMLKDSDIRREKNEMKQNFDKVFLRLFPTFIQDYNALFEQPAADGAELESQAELTPEMRIFALIRMGITDCADIARFLNFSVNTVNTYKTRAKNRSTVPNDRFEAKIMEIRSLS